MRLRFLGTRGEIELSTRLHRRHSSLLVESAGGGRLVIDWGLDWLGRLPRLRPDAVLLTHAHPDHAWGLRAGADCPVFATAATARILAPYPVSWVEVEPRRPFPAADLTIEAFGVEHSIRAPAVAYRVSEGTAAFLYVPDVVHIPERAEALGGCALYIGDAATMERSFVRRRGERLIGHTPVRTQLTWCAREGVPRAIFTHCGSEVVGGDGRRLAALLRRWGRERGVEARFARDGLRIHL